MHRKAQFNPQSEDSIESIKKLSQVRELRAKEVLMAGKPQLLSEEEFIVPSSNGKDSYKVLHLDSWSCSCPDFKHNCQKIGIYCKHIKALQLFLKLRGNQEVENFDILQIAQEEGNCPSCNSENITKQGYRINKSGKKQKFKCSDCEKNFVSDPIKNHKANAKIITLTMDLYFKGLSLRDITDTLNQFYGIDLHHETIRRWVLKFTKVMNNYTKTLKAETSNTWHADEQMVKTKDKDFIYNWNVMDKETKFVLATHSSRGRSIDDAKKVMLKAKEQAKQIPEVIITDKLPSYQEGISKAFRNWQSNTHKQVKHISIVGKRSIVNNNLIENHHTHFREFDKIRRGINEVQDYSDGFNIFRNFIKKGMDGLTPAERAKIPIVLNDNRWLKLLKESVKK